MTTVGNVVSYLKQFAPLELAESWDNVGLLIGDLDAVVDRVVTCLTLTPDVAEEAVEGNVDLVVTHHPVLFRAVQRLTTETVEGAMLLKLIRAGVAVYSPHTAFDSAPTGINWLLAHRLGLQNIQPLRVLNPATGVGSGRWGTLPRPVPLHVFLETISKQLKVQGLQFVGDREKTVSKVGIACGAAGEFLTDAQGLGCDLLLTGETRFHTCLEARSLGIGLVLAGHYATERFALDWLAQHLAEQFPELTIWASRVESDPLLVP